MMAEYLLLSGQSACMLMNINPATLSKDTFNALIQQIQDPEQALPAGDPRIEQLNSIKNNLRDLDLEVQESLRIALVNAEAEYLLAVEREKQTQEEITAINRTAVERTTEVSSQGVQDNEKTAAKTREEITEALIDKPAELLAQKMSEGSAESVRQWSIEEFMQEISKSKDFITKSSVKLSNGQDAELRSAVVKQQDPITGHATYFVGVNDFQEQRSQIKDPQDQATYTRESLDKITGQLQGENGLTSAKVGSTQAVSLETLDNISAMGSTIQTKEELASSQPAKLMRALARPGFEAHFAKMQQLQKAMDQAGIDRDSVSVVGLNAALASKGLTRSDPNVLSGAVTEGSKKELSRALGIEPTAAAETVSSPAPRPFASKSFQEELAAAAEKRTPGITQGSTPRGPVFEVTPKPAGKDSSGPAMGG